MIAKGEKRSVLPVSREEYIRRTLELCKSGSCCRDLAILEAAYLQYVSDPKAPWNRRRAGKLDRRIG